MKPRLLFFVEAFGGGILSYVQALTNSLSDDFDIFVAYGTREQTPDEDKLGNMFNESISLIKVANFTREINLIKDFKALKEMNHIIKEIAPDIVHLHSSKAGVLGRVTAVRNKKVKYFYTPHGYSFLIHGSSKGKHYMYLLIEKFLGYGRCETIACSFGEFEESKKVTKKSQYVNNSINTKEIDMISNELPANRKIDGVYTVGRIDTQKNPEEFNELAKKLPDIDFTWVGDGPKRSLLSSPNINVTGWLERKDVINIAVNKKIFILTSLWEGLPIALLEAMYTEHLCIVSDVVGNRDVITKEANNGYVYSDIDELVDFVKDNEKNIDLKKINNAKKDIEDNYSIENMAAKYKRIYLN
ncbi:glycosyl transferase [Latilactobacillus curvatus]|uniref:Glycosyl transferase n=1 Tax=Latilactobacillus curvatus TaxID=28038 RepID=A0AAC9UJZ7_LATCU|nr:glycosyltransferase [Latilactobacillus curvatus]ASN59588.1 glycosyl transferase [Latilactobacillus curvatus]